MSPGLFPACEGKFNRHPYAVRFELHPIHQRGNRGGLFGLRLNQATPVACCVENPFDSTRVVGSFRCGFKNRRLVIEHFPDGNRDSIFEFSRRQPPAEARRRKSLCRDVARHVVAVLSLSLPCVTGCKSITILVDQSPDEGTLFDTGVAALAADSMLPKLQLGSFPHRSIHDRLMLTGMAEVLVPDLADVNRIGEERVKRTSGERVPARLDSGL